MEVVSFEMSWPARSVTPLDGVSVILLHRPDSRVELLTLPQQRAPAKKYTLYYPSEMRAVRNAR
jgi:hypothetical protein